MCNQYTTNKNITACTRWCAVVLSAASVKLKDPLSVDVQSIHNKQKHNCLQSLDCCHSERSRGIPQAEMCNNKKEYTNNKKTFKNNSHSLNLITKKSISNDMLFYFTFLRFYLHIQTN